MRLVGFANSTRPSRCLIADLAKGRIRASNDAGVLSISIPCGHVFPVCPERLAFQAAPSGISCCSQDTLADVGFAATCRSAS